MACNNCDPNKVTLLQGDTGAAGAAGAAGADGVFGGYSGEWSFSTSTASGPSATELRLDNATPASVTKIYISDTNIDSVDFDLYLDSLSNGGDYGNIRLFDEADNTTFWMGTVTGVTDNGTDHTIDVTYITHNNTFSAADNIVVTFSPSGANGSNGSNGAAGADGTTLYYNALVNSGDTADNMGANTLATVHTVSAVVPGGTLTAAGDSVVLEGIIYNSAPGERESWMISLDGTNNILDASAKGHPFFQRYEFVQFKLTLNRTNATTGWALMEYIPVTNVGSPGTDAAGNAYVSQNIGGANPYIISAPSISFTWANDIDVTLRAVSDDAAAAHSFLLSTLSAKFYNIVV